MIEPLFESRSDHAIMYAFAQKLGFADQFVGKKDGKQKLASIKTAKGYDEPNIEDVARERDQPRHLDHRLHRPVARAALKLHMSNMHVFDVKTLRAKGGPCDGDYFGLPWPCYGNAGAEASGLAEPLRHVAQRHGRRRQLPRELRRRARRREPARRGRLGLRRAPICTFGYPEFDHVLLKKLGWWDELTDAEKKEAEGKNWKTDLSGGIQRVVMKNHSCHPFGNAKARAVVWNFPDGVPLHREPLYSPRPDLIDKYPTHDDEKVRSGACRRCSSRCRRATSRKLAEKFPLILTSAGAWSSTKAAATRRGRTRGSPSCSRTCSSRSTRRRRTTAASATTSTSG